MLNTILGSFSTGVAPSTTSYESIASVTVGSGGSSQIEFTSIPATYTHLQVRGIWAHSTTNVAAVIRLNTDAGANYTQHILRGNGDTASASGQTDLTGTGATIASNSGAGGFGASIIDILDYTNTNKYTTMRILAGQDVNGAGNLRLYSGLWLNTNAITNIRIIPNDSTFNQYTQWSLYGIKGS